MCRNQLIMFWLRSLLIFSVLFYSQVSCYKILVLSPIPARSHYNLAKGIADVLHHSNHEVTFVSPFRNEKPLYREIEIEGIRKLKETTDDDMIGFTTTKQSKIALLYKISTFIGPMTQLLLEDPEMKNLMADKNEKFDLVVLEHFLNDLYIGFAVKFDAPLILISPISLMSWLATKTGNPIAPSTVPNTILPFTRDMNLWQRTINTGMAVFQEFIGWWLIDPAQKAFYQDLFPDEAKKVPFENLNSRISLIMSNTHPSIGSARPFLPNVVEVGGYHIGEAEPLPQDLQTIMDSAKDGVIYFSMGSNLKSSQMSKDTQLNILMALSTLKQTVLWKFEEDLPGKPHNVIIRKWMPQTSILAHPNVKLFISHGGLLSCTEAIHYGVPMLVMPIFGDQNHNAVGVVERGHGISIDYLNLTESSSPLTWALNELLTNPRYAENTKKLHKLYHDRPLKPRDMVKFYAEHVIRTGGAPHLSSPKLSRCSDLLLDVFVFISVPPFLLLVVAAIACRKCFKGNLDNKSENNKSTKLKGKKKKN